MQEGQVTVEGQTHRLPTPFHVLATANPVEYEGTYPLPEAQLDRFLLRVALRLPDGRGGVRRPAPSAGPPARGGRHPSRSPMRPAWPRCRRAVERVVVDESVARYCVDLAAATRAHNDVLTGASPRGSLGLVLTARAWAAIRGRDFVVPEDVKVRGARGARAPDHRQARPLDDPGLRRAGRRLGARRPSRRPARWSRAGDPLAADAVARPGLPARARRPRRRGGARPGACWWCWPPRSWCSRGMGLIGRPTPDAGRPHAHRPPPAPRGPGHRPRGWSWTTLDGRRARHPGRRPRRRTSPTRPTYGAAGSLVRRRSADDRVQPATVGPTLDRQPSGSR